MSFSDRTRQMLLAQAGRAQARVVGSQGYRPGGDRSGMLTSAGPGVGRALRDFGDWSRSTRKAVSSIRRLRTQGAVLVDPALVDVTLSWMAAAAPPLATAFEKHLVPVFEHVVAQWPTRTGASRDGLYLAVVKLGADKVAMRTGGLADYTLFVRYARSGEQRLTEFQRRVVGAMRDRMARGATRLEVATWAAEAFELADNIPNGIRRALGWMDKLTRKREVYRLPSGGDAAGEPAWQRQAVEPWRGELQPMATTVEHELARLIGQASRRAA